MQIVNVRLIILRLVVMGILALIFVPFLPPKPRWSFMAAFGSDRADSLLHEFFDEPPPSAREFRDEFGLPQMPMRGNVIDGSDVRYIEVTDEKSSADGRWVLHLKWNAYDRALRFLEKRPSDTIWLSLESGWNIYLSVGRIESPMIFNPRAFGDYPSSMLMTYGW